ncbi:MAG: hypothetical protein H0W88_04850 [Parachlamydiaceae bacterium]|nr:hypothetical protein [Parachlamydiaceae bacterium]
MTSVNPQIQPNDRNLNVSSLGIKKRLNNLGLFPGLKKLYSIEGLENGLVPILISVFQILKVGAGAERLDGWLDVLRGQRDLYRATIIVPTSLQFLESNSVSNGLMALAHWFETLQFLKHAEVCSFDFYTRWSQNVGKINIFQSNIANFCLKSPKNFFILCSSLWDLGLLGKSYYFHPKTAGINPETFKEESPLKVEAHIQIKRREDLFDVAIRIGRISQVILKSYYVEGKSRWGNSYLMIYYLVSLGTQSVNFVRFLIK